MAGAPRIFVYVTVISGFVVTVADRTGGARRSRANSVLEDRSPLLEVRLDRFRLVLGSDQRADRLALVGELVGERAAGRLVEQPLDAPDRLRALAGDLAGEGEGVVEGRVADLGGEADLRSF